LKKEEFYLTKEIPFRDRIKYDEKGEIERVFSPRYGWNNMPEEVRERITSYNLK
jgi:hypothetical protein